MYREPPTAVFEKKNEERGDEKGKGRGECGL